MKLQPIYTASAWFIINSATRISAQNNIPETTTPEQSPSYTEEQCNSWTTAALAADTTNSGGLTQTEYFAFLQSITDPPSIGQYYASIPSFEDLSFSAKIVNKLITCGCSTLPGYDPTSCCSGSDAELPLAGFNVTNGELLSVEEVAYRASFCEALGNLVSKVQPLVTTVAPTPLLSLPTTAAPTLQSSSPTTAPTPILSSSTTAPTSQLSSTSPTSQLSSSTTAPTLLPSSAAPTIQVSISTAPTDPSATTLPTTTLTASSTNAPSQSPTKPPSDIIIPPIIEPSTEKPPPKLPPGALIGILIAAFIGIVIGIIIVVRVSREQQERSRESDEEVGGGGGNPGDDDDDASSVPSVWSETDGKDDTNVVVDNDVDLEEQVAMKGSAVAAMGVASTVVTKMSSSKNDNDEENDAGGSVVQSSSTEREEEGYIGDLNETEEQQHLEKGEIGSAIEKDENETQQAQDEPEVDEASESKNENEKEQYAKEEHDDEKANVVAHDEGDTVVSNPPLESNEKDGAKNVNENNDEEQQAKADEVPVPKKAEKGDVIISSIHFKDQEESEYVEITNTLDSPVDISGFAVEDVTPLTFFGIKGAIFKFPDSAVLKEGEKVRVYSNEINKEYGGYSFESEKDVWKSTGGTARLTDASGKTIVYEFKYAGLYR